MFFIDVGSKDRLDSCFELSSITDMVGFEPNPIELDRLRNKNQQHPFQSLQLESSCLSDSNGEVDFYITKHASMSSLLPSDAQNYRKHFGTYQQFVQWQDNIALDKIVRVPSITLDDYLKDFTANVDYLKIDTQGSELQVLKGAEKWLNDKRINVLKIEVSTVAVYQNQVLFSDIDVFLRSKGYVLVDFMTYRDNYRPVFGKPEHKQHHYAPCGDAIYILDTQYLTESNTIKSAVLLFWLGYYSLGFHLLQNTAITKNDQKSISAFRFTEPRSKLKQLLINLCPPMLLHWLKK
ncbi:FkbM family methyltransferase [Flavobacterium sp.]|uniref:FkbM family methyltransferase n=1 Tax=Flavobacterium sp. TaxID=239 RepID=UPI002FDD527B